MAKPVAAALVLLAGFARATPVPAAVPAAVRAAIAARLAGLAVEAAEETRRAEARVRARTAAARPGETEPAGAAAALERLARLGYRLEPLDAAALLQGERDAAAGVAADQGLVGYDAEVQAIDSGEPHSLDDVQGYVVHRIGDFVVRRMRADPLPCELHAGPLGLALGSLRARGFGAVHRVVDPSGTEDDTDGLFLGFRMRDATPLWFHAGSLGRERFLHAQALLRLAGIPPERVVRYPHRVPLDPLLEGLDVLPTGPEDLAAVGFSEGPVEELLGRETARRRLVAFRALGWRTAADLARALGLAPGTLPPGADDVLRADPDRVLDSGALAERITALVGWLERAGVRGLPAPAAPRLARLPLAAPFLELRLARFADQAGAVHQLLLVGPFWGELVERAGQRLAELGFRRVLFLGIAGGLRPGAKIGQVLRVGATHGEGGEPIGRLASWLGPEAEGLPSPPEARQIGTFSPLAETRRVVDGWRRRGFDAVDVESHLLARGLLGSHAPPPAFEDLLVVSDLPAAGPGRTLETRWLHRSALREGVSRALDQVLARLGAVRLVDTDPEDAARAPRRIGAMTGTFDPPHAGHVRLAAEARQALGLDQLWLIPNAAPPHKPGASPYRARTAMTARAIENEPGLCLLAGPEVRDAYREGGPAKVLDLLDARLGPATRLFQIMGSDSFAALAARPDHLLHALGRARIAVARRPGLGGDEAFDAWLLAHPASGVIALPSPVPESLGSTAIRARAARGEPLGAEVAPAVAALVGRYRLYRAQRPPAAEPDGTEDETEP